MRIEFIAHATFRITLRDGRIIIIDPYKGMSFQGRFNYPEYVTRADIVAITHDHLDHNYVVGIEGEPVIVRDEAEVSGVKITSHRVWHDRFEGTKFGGAVDMKLIEAEGVRVLHMGDCGEVLSDERLSAFGKLDVVMIPCGGFYTIDGREAADIAKRLGARVTIPCHYKTRLCDLPISDELEFCTAFERVTRLGVSELEVGSVEGVTVLEPKMSQIRRSGELIFQSGSKQGSE